MCAKLAKMPQAGAFAAITQIGAMAGEKKMLDALKAARQLQRGIEEAAEAQYPVPCSRRNSPLAFDAKNNVFVLFGGDHEDYLMDDTWVLDLAKKSWKRAKPQQSPSPRAGHALFALGDGVGLYEGYIQSNSLDYGAGPSAAIDPIQLWRYDAKLDQWNLLGQGPVVKKGATSGPVPSGEFYGYSSDCFSPPPIAADEQGRIVLENQPGRSWKTTPARTFILQPDVTKTDAEAMAKLARPANERLYRTGSFPASFCEVANEPAAPDLQNLPENQWVKLPKAPRNPCEGCRQRDWGTAVWDSDREQILLWGGGHCVRSSSSVVHWSPASGRLVESYDADEPYGGNGGGGFDSTLLNRPWVSVHNYNHYAYDPKCKLMVAVRGYLYDPQRMDWLRMEPMPTPFTFIWGSTVVETSPHGAVAWARSATRRVSACGSSIARRAGASWR